MRRKILKDYKKTGPEQKIQEDIIKYLREREWLVIPTHGNAYQMGLPDLYCAHYSYTTRWVEVKNPLSYSFTPAQRQIFPELQGKGVGIWIMFYADELEYQRLFQPPNWYHHWDHTSYKRIGAATRG